MYRLLTIIILAVLTSLQGIAQQRGKATYYSKRATGARTSSGIRLHHDSLTCAHRTYPFGTKLLVKNLSNGKEVVVTVTDRGPYGRGKIIDLTYEAARRIGMLNAGIATVEVSLYSDNKGIPFAREEEGLPEFDFGANDLDDGTDNNVPVWQRDKKEKTTKGKSGKNKKGTSKKNSSSGKSASADKNPTNGKNAANKELAINTEKEMMDDPIKVNQDKPAKDSKSSKASTSSRKSKGKSSKQGKRRK